MNTKEIGAPEVQRRHENRLKDRHPVGDVSPLYRLFYVVSMKIVPAGCVGSPPARWSLRRLLRVSTRYRFTRQSAGQSAKPERLRRQP